MILCLLDNTFVTLHHNVYNPACHVSFLPPSGCCDHPSLGHRAQFVSSSLQCNGSSHPADEPPVSGDYRHCESPLLSFLTHLALHPCRKCAMTLGLSETSVMQCIVKCQKTTRLSRTHYTFNPGILEDILFMPIL